MLSLAVIKSSAAAVSYFEKDDYYAQEGGEADAQGQWWGEGAERLGLQGAVDRDVFKAVLDGHLPNGVDLGTRKEGQFVHRPGWDLTFSAPKSVSVAAEVGGDKRLFTAHDTAVKVALAWMQKNSAGYRQRGFLSDRERPTDNLVVALFQHDTSRSQDPQLHTHAVTANVTQRPDGRWVSLYESWMFDDKMAGGTVYRAALAMELQRLGYAIEVTDRDGRFELAGVPQNVLEAFSTRREQIEQALSERGLEGAEAAAQAAVMTRANKQGHDRAELLQAWRDKADGLGFDAEQMAKTAGAAGDLTPTEPFSIDRAVINAIDRLSDTEAVFSRADLLRWSLAGAMGRASPAEVEAAVKRAQDNQRLILTRLEGRDAWTTPQAKEQERRVLEAVQRGQNAIQPAMSPADAERDLQSAGLNVGQQAAVKLIASSPDRMVGVLGRPGTGKTFMLGTARQMLEARGYSLVGMAGNSEAARQLGQDANIESGTLAKHLTTVNRDIAALRSADAKQNKAIRSGYAKQVWVVDEASQLGSGDMRRLTFAAEVLGARIVLVGDPQQLASISAGKPFAQMLKNGMKHVELDELRRQEKDSHKAAVRAAIQGDVNTAMQLLSAETVQVPDRDSRLAAILSAWKALGADRGQTLMLTARNVDKTALNDGARAILRTEGQLKDETPQRQLFRVFSQRADREHAQLYQKGDVVLFGRSVAALTIGRGEYLDVAGVDTKSNTVTLQRTLADGKVETLQWNPRRVAGGAKRGVELYRPRQTTLGEGDRIQWNRNTPGSFKNGQALTVVKVSAESVTVRTGSGQLRQISTKDSAGQHWEHDYAGTIYKSQGATKQHVLVNAEAGQKELFNQKAFLVGISRQKDTIRLFTDDTVAFIKNVSERLGEKTSAQESFEQGRMHRVSGYLEQLLKGMGQPAAPTRNDGDRSQGNR